MPPSFLDIELYASSRATVAQLKQFEPSRHDAVRLFKKFAPRQLDCYGIVTAFEAIGDLPNLRRLELCAKANYMYCQYHHNYSGTGSSVVGDGNSSHGNGITDLPVQALTKCLQRSLHLKDLLMDRVELCGDTPDLQALADVVRTHPTLERVYINECNASPQAVPLNVLLEAAAANPHVKTLSATHCNWVGIGATLRRLGALTQGLESLRLKGPLTHADPTDWLHFAQGLQHNTSLKEVKITSCQVPAGVGIAMARLIKCNKALEKFAIEMQAIQDIVPLCCALATNDTLNALEVMVQSPGPAALQQAVTNLLARAMRSNYTLANLSLCSPTAMISNPTLEFYLRLNRSGERRHWVTRGAFEMSKSEWMDILAAHAQDLTTLHYILTLNPTLVVGSSFSSEPKGLPKEVRGKSSLQCADDTDAPPRKRQRREVNSR